jgi:hypothetical protein
MFLGIRKRVRIVSSNPDPLHASAPGQARAVP